MRQNTNKCKKNIFTYEIFDNNSYSIKENGQYCLQQISK